MFLVKPGFGWTHDFRWNSSQLIVIFPMNRNRNRFAKSTSVQIGIGIVCEFQNFQIWIWIIFVIREVFANNSRIPDIYLFSKKCLTNSFFYCYFFSFEKFTGQTAKVWYMNSAYSSFIFKIRIRYSWILYKIFLNRNNICQIKKFENRNNIHDLKLWQIGIGIYLWSKYQRIDLWRIYLQTIRQKPCCHHK